MDTRSKFLAVNSWKYNINQKDIPEAYARQTGIELIDLDLRLKLPDALYNLITGRSYHISRFNSPIFADRVGSVLQSESFDIVQLESIFTGPYVPVIRKYSGARIVLRAHNIEHLIWERIAGETRNPLKKWYLGKLACTLKKYEEGLVHKVDGIVPITRNDARYFENVAGNPTLVPIGNKVKVCAIPFGLEPPVEPGETVALQPALFTIGSMNWIPNQEGVKWFLDNVWPDVHKQFPHLQYFIAGRAMPPWMKNLSLPNVIVPGEVEDAAAFMKNLPVMIVPLFSGSGIRIKIIEGMAAGKTVISTSLGAEGIECVHQKNILIADTPCEFFEMISICITDPIVHQKIGAEARKLIRDSYNQRTLIRQLTSFYQQIS